MDSSDTETDNGPPAPKKRPVPVKALEALAKAREIKAKQREEAKKEKVEIKAKKEEAVKAVDAIRLTTTETQPPVSNPAPAAAPDYIKSLEEKLHALESKLVSKKPKKKKVVIESDSSSEEEIVIKKKSVKKVPAPVDDGALNAFREFQTKQMAQQQAIDKAKAENDRLRALFTRN